MMPNCAVAIFAVVSLLTSFAIAQTKSAPAKPDHPAATKSSTRPKRTAPDPQYELAIRLLNEAEAEAGVLDAAGRAGLLYLIGETYAAKEKPKAREILQSAYQNAVVAYDQRPKAVGFMMSDLVAATVKVAPDSVEESLPQDGFARDFALRLLITEHLAHKDANRALELLFMMNSDESMTYAAIELLMALPPSRQDDRDHVFATVLQAYKNSKHAQVGTGSPEDLGTLIVRFHGLVNRGLVQEAIDVLLREAKSMPQYVVMSTAQETMTFSSYNFRLFQLLPALRQIDPVRADSLLEETETASLFQQYPDGQRSVDPWLRDTPMKDGELRQTQYAYVRDNSPKAQGAKMEIDRTVDRFAAQAEVDPDSAIANVLRTSDGAVRTRLLLQIAQNCQQKNPAAAKAGLRQILSSPPDDPNEFPQLKIAADIAQRLGDKDLANALIELGLKFARSLYDFEADKDEPNSALKVNWVSVRAYRELLGVQIKLAPDSALQNIKDLPDTELRAIARVMVAAVLLNAPLPETSPVGKTPKAKRA